MVKVVDFWDVVMLNGYHNVRIKSHSTDEVLAFFDSSEGLEKSGYSDYKIKHFATDWNSKTYILFV